MLSVNMKKLNATLRILKNDKKQYSVIYDKLQISKCNEPHDTEG